MSVMNSLCTPLTHLQHYDKPENRWSHHSSATDSWLQETAEMLVTKTLMPTDSTDPAFKSFLHQASLYVDLREAIRWENGPQVVRHWKYWLPHFLAEGCTNFRQRRCISYLIWQLCSQSTYRNSQPNRKHEWEVRTSKDSWSADRALQSVSTKRQTLL